MGGTKAPYYNIAGLTNHLSLLFRGVLFYLALAYFAALFPFRIWDPIWYLKVGQIANDFSITFLFGLSLGLMCRYLDPSNERRLATKKNIQRIASFALIFYAVLIPVQLLSFGIVVIRSEQQQKEILKVAERKISTVKSLISNTTSERQLNDVIGSPQRDITKLDSEALGTQQKKAIEAINNEFFKLRSRTKQESQFRFSMLLISTTKGVIGSAILTVLMFYIRRIKFAA